MIRNYIAREVQRIKNIGKRVREWYSEWTAPQVATTFNYGEAYTTPINLELARMEARPNGDRYTVPENGVMILLKGPGVAVISGKQRDVDKVHRGLQEAIENAIATGNVRTRLTA